MEDSEHAGLKHLLGYIVEGILAINCFIALIIRVYVVMKFIHWAIF